MKAERKAKIVGLFRGDLETVLNYWMDLDFH